MKKSNGFTLLEMAVVVVVIGLIVGGVVAGQSLLHSARIRETIGQYDRYMKAIKEFQDKYNALPGDMINATTIWGTDARSGGCPNTNTSTVVQTTTCNGNGDGVVGTSAAYYEWFRVWQHLSNAGLIEGKYSGVRGPAGADDAEIGVNVPQAALRQKAGWMIYYYIQTTTTGDWWGDNYGHIFRLGADTTAASNAPVLVPADAMAIDLKIDDGKPGTGTVRSRRTASDANCTSGDNGLLDTTAQATTTYRTSYTAIACALLIITGF